MTTIVDFGDFARWNEEGSDPAWPLVGIMLQHCCNRLGSPKIKPDAFPSDKELIAISDAVLAAARLCKSHAVDADSSLRIISPEGQPSSELQDGYYLAALHGKTAAELARLIRPLADLIHAEAWAQAHDVAVFELGGGQRGFA